MSTPFRSIAEAQQIARRRLPVAIYDSIVAGSGRNLTAKDNVAAFDELSFAPRSAGQPLERDLTTVVMGQQVAMPVLMSPVGVQAVHPDGEVAVARAAAAFGTVMGLSSFASRAVEEVTDAGARTLFQVYWSGGREAVKQRIARARAAGCVGLIVTLDWTFPPVRDSGAPRIPERITPWQMVRFAPQAIARPRWALQVAARRWIPTLEVPNMQVVGGEVQTFASAYREWRRTPLPSWDDVAWLRRQWDGPFMVKGIARIDEARRAVDAGATAISVSNHGGNNLDGTPASIRLLPAIAQAVDSEVEVLLDGGIRRGGDVVKALALGAKAVMIGRAYLWGVAVDGEAGVGNVLEILRAGIDSALIGVGAATPADVYHTDLIVPNGFARTLGPVAS